MEEKNEKEDAVTLGEVLKQYQESDEEFEQECREVLGGSDDKNCTYSEGYVKRQALYACLTCTPDARTDSSKRSGVCLACANNCHDGHDLIELYTKRNFRCDCGTAKILAVRCKLDENKLEQNDKNAYNQNFSGIYCTCHRPYPDPEDDIVDEMIQCIICEDWYHGRHLQSNVPSEFSEMICGDCMKQNEFLHCYTGLSVLKDSDLDTTVDTSIVSVGNDDSVTDEKEEALLKDEINQSIMNIIEINKSNSETKEIGEPMAKKQKLDDSDNGETNTICKKPTMAGANLVGATFWPLNWRKHLCVCEKCDIERKTLKVEFLTDLQDTVDSYQEKGLAKTHESREERAMKAFSKIDHNQQLTVLRGYNHLRNKLFEFLRAFAVNDQTVTEDDINRFFRTMNDNTTN